MGNHKVSLRGGFSDRMGIKTENTEIQTTSLDNRTRVAVLNLTNALYHKTFENDYYGERMYGFHLNLMRDVYTEKLDYNGIASYFDGRATLNVIEGTILNDDYDAVLTLVEYLVGQIDEINRVRLTHIDVQALYNKLFQMEYVGYRFINGQISPITDELEAQEISAAFFVDYENVKKHLKKALDFISERNQPDYENSIKESISAVEAMCISVAEGGNTLNDALKELKKRERFSIHPALESAFSKLYGYTSDDDSGIRHAAGLGGSNSTFAEARFMLVACTAFINYLKINVSNEGKDLDGGDNDDR